MVCEHVYMNISPPPPIIKLAMALLNTSFEITLFECKVLDTMSFLQTVTLRKATHDVGKHSIV